MPVDQKVLEAAIEEASAGDAEIAQLLREKFTKNDNAAVAFTGGFMRNRDYTQGKQSLAAEKTKVEGQLKQYQTALEAAEAEKTKIMKDLANQRVSVAQANARLQAVKETYSLDDSDIPPMGDLIDTRKTGKVHDSTPDLDERFAAFETQFMDKVSKTLLPELGGLTRLSIIWDDLNDQHRELVGKRLTLDEKEELLKSAKDNNTNLVTAWERKYGIPDVRKGLERQQIVKEERAKWDAEQTARRSQEAMEGIRPHAQDETGLRLSPILKKEFHERGTDPVAPGATKPGEHARLPSSEQREKLSGAERAAVKYMERRSAGIPMGQKEKAS